MVTPAAQRAWQVRVRTDCARIDLCEGVKQTTNEQANEPTYHILSVNFHPSIHPLPPHQAGDAAVAERGVLYEGAVQVDERLGRVVGAIKVSVDVVVVFCRLACLVRTDTDTRFLPIHFRSRLTIYLSNTHKRSSPPAWAPCWSGA